MKRHGNLYNLMASEDNVRQAIRNACKNNSRCSVSKIKAIKYTKEHFEEVFQNVYGIMQSESYRPSDYSIYITYDPKLRLVYCLPFFYDRIIHHCIMNVLSPIWDRMLYVNSFSCREGKGQHHAGTTLAQYARKYDYALMMDISQFYVSIPHNKLKALYARKIKDKKVLAILEDIVDSIDPRQYSLDFYKRNYNNFRVSPDAIINKLETGLKEFGYEAAGVPIGNLTSQWDGNIYMNEGDNYALHELDAEGLVGYCDNRAIFSNSKDKLKFIRRKMEEFYHDELHLLLSQSEIRATKYGIPFCGYVYYQNGAVQLKSSSKIRQRRTFKEIKRNLDHGLVSVERAMCQLGSMGGVLSHAQTYNFRNKLGYDKYFSEVKEIAKIQRFCF